MPAWESQQIHTLYSVRSAGPVHMYNVFSIPRQAQSISFRCSRFPLHVLSCNKIFEFKEWCYALGEIAPCCGHYLTDKCGGPLLCYLVTNVCSVHCSVHTWLPWLQQWAKLLSFMLLFKVLFNWHINTYYYCYVFKRVESQQRYFFTFTLYNLMQRTTKLSTNWPSRASQDKFVMSAWN